MDHSSYYGGKLPDYYGGLLPDGIFYRHPWHYRVPEGYFESLWTRQYLDDIGGLVPDLEVLLAVDIPSFLLGGAVAAAFAYQTGDITECMNLNWPPSQNWYDHFLHLKRIKFMTYIYGYLTIRYVGRILLGGATYLALRHYTHVVWMNCFGGHYGICGNGTSFGALWASGAVYSTVWTVFYTRESGLWNFIGGCWVGLGMGLVELLFGSFYELFSSVPNVNFLK